MNNFDNFAPLLKLEEKIKEELSALPQALGNIEKNMEGFPLPDYEEKSLYTEIEIGRLSEMEVKAIKKAIHSIGYKWKSGNSFGNSADSKLTMISPLETSKEKIKESKKIKKKKKRLKKQV